MRGEIIKIDKPQKSRNGGIFIRVCFKLSDGRWAKADLVPSFRNFGRWENLLRLGNVLDCLTMRDEETVDADSFPILREYPNLSLEDERMMNFSKSFL